MYNLLVFGSWSKSEALGKWERMQRQKAGWRVTQSLYWCEILRQSLGHNVYYLTAWRNTELVAVFPLVLIRGLFGKFLISVPYVNWGGVQTNEPQLSTWLACAAVHLAEHHDVRYLEIRGEVVPDAYMFQKRTGHKVTMVRELPYNEAELWNQLGCKVRNQVRKAQRSGLVIEIGGEDLISDFYSLYAENMRNLGTPPYPLRFVRAIGQYFRDRFEVILVREHTRPLAGGILLHGNCITELPMAASRPDGKKNCANMLLYWQVLVSSLRRQNWICDFGRSSPGSGSYHFKKQWGAKPEPLIWHYYARQRSPAYYAKEHPRFQRWSEWWKRLPVPLTTWLGPWLVKGLPV